MAQPIDHGKAYGRFYVTSFEPFQKLKGIDLALGDFTLVDIRRGLAEFGSERALRMFGLFPPRSELGSQLAVTK